jgi:hypothetical protein
MSAPIPELHGVLAEFATPEAAVTAAKALRAAGFTALDAYGPFPSPELAEAIGFRETKMAKCVLGGGVVGGLAGYALVYWATVLDYPHNVGGRPFNSWPSFIPILFETTVLAACATGIVSLLVICGLPRLAHPVFTAPSFRRVTTDHFFVTVRATSADFSPSAVGDVLGRLDPLSVTTLEEQNRP